MFAILLISFIVICIGTIIFLLLIGQQSDQTKSLMSVLGSGGHTHEMLTLIKSLIIQEESKDSKHFPFEEIIFIVSRDDEFSVEKLNQIIPEWSSSSSNDQTNSIRFQLHRIQRSRQVHQNYISSIWTTLISLYHSFKIIFKIRPKILLCNGPGVCIPVIIACRIISNRTNIIFVESFCRTRSLSLTGKILYHTKLVNHFMVQWPKLVGKYPRAKFLGLLV
ncbi:ALG14, UDP-N-acetylglucosaminyltransferase subunit [Dermatophagoides pteronyssinus]|uniref:ALG14, UDP-N-acetylglucosaminyltransferase subunit n=1 Tax=Dermatophagoides pteronyssinus TaxID=6956 RepID=UPI003F673D04